jgi:hypothetical protein
MHVSLFMNADLNPYPDKTAKDEAMFFCLDEFCLDEGRKTKTWIQGLS